MANQQTDAGPLAEFTSRPTFQLSIPALDLAAARLFYHDLLGSRVEREDEHCIECAFFGGRLTLYRVDKVPEACSGERGGKRIPIPSFGLLMSWEDWHRAVDHLNYVGVSYRLAPSTFAHHGAQEAWFAIADPSGNVLSFGARQEGG